MTFTTAADVDRLPVTAKRYDAADTDVPGLRVRVTPNGVKTYSLLYRVKGERTKRRITLGTTRAIDLGEARKMARRHRVTAENGTDPADAHRAKRQAEQAAKIAAAAERTVAELGVLYLAHCAVRDAESTRTNRESRWTRYVVPALGHLTPATVTKQDVATLHRDMRVTATAETQPPTATRATTANRVVELVSAFFTWCADQALVPDGTNPTRRIKKYDEESRERFLTSEELGRLVAAITTAETVGLPTAPKRQREEPSEKNAKHAPPPKPGKKNRARGSIAPANPYAIAALRLLLLTGWREQEVLSLRWDAVDLERKVATLRETKGGKSQRIMSASAIALVASLPRHHGSPWCFPSPRDPKRHLIDVGRLWDAVRHAAALDGFRLHDMRHSAASFAIGAGASLAVIGKMLGHKNSTTTQRYAHLADDPVRAATELVASAVAGATNPRTTPVMELHSKTAKG